jgi:nicotinate (nicotinamide) nucleotide adenylyltransferase/ribosome silencing factor RsfS/YbeB/iojap
MKRVDGRITSGQGDERKAEVRRHRRIGLLGGSFNPAHGGHWHISRLALRRLDLDEVWWLVSPQNPLKPVAGMAPFARRLQQARKVAAAHPRIHVTGIEAELGSRYTAVSLALLRRRFPRHHFVWLMGGDNLRQIRHWQRWPAIFQTMPIAVFDRPATSLGALSDIAARRYARHRVPLRAARGLADMTPPAWVFFHSQLDPRSATQIRAARNRPPRQTLMEKRPEVSTITTLRPRARRTALARGELLRLILDTLDEGKGESVVAIDLAGKTTLADHMVVASGRSTRQVIALTEHLVEALAGRVHLSVEGKAQGDWVLIDAGDVIVHLFRPEVRAHYNLEKMWGADLPDIEAARH